MNKLLLLFLLLFSIKLNAQDSLLIEQIKKHIHTFQVNETSFTGTAADLLKKELDQHQFVLIGEAHGLHEIGQFTKLLFQEAQPKGFEHLVVETDTYGAEKLMEMVKQENYLAEGKSYFGTYPFSIPFYNTVVDLDLIHQVVKQSKAEQAIWGIDQIFMGATRLIFSEMAQQTKDAASKEMALAYAEKAKSGFQQIIEKKRFDSAYMLHFGQEDYERLVAQFENEPHLANMVKDLQVSKDIYMYNFQGKIYDNNYNRSQWMKKQFIQYYQAAKTKNALPKAIFRLGANHCGRGLNFTNVFDIGNFASELAAFNQSSSFHIMIGGLKGTQNQFIPIAPEMAKKAPYDGLQQLDIHLQKAIEGSTNKDWLLIDFRPLRRLHRKQLAKADEKLKDLIFNFDVLILMPEVQGTTLLTDQP